MGIKYLNRFLMDNCSKKSIKKCHLSALKNKRFVIDASIYMYKFKGENALMEHMYLFISILKHYEIEPIFVFDGKPPAEKKEILIKRRMDKLDAEQKYIEIQKQLEHEVNEETKQDLLASMDTLKKQFITIKDEDIKKVKELLESYGVVYYVSPGEADQYCAHLIKQNIADGCISDDMDMFLYDCKIIVRHISLLNHTIVMYDCSKILKDLKLSRRLFCEIMVLSGTDYNLNMETSLYESIRWYYEYIKYLEKYAVDKNVTPPLTYYVWLIKNTKYIKDYGKLLKTYQMFQLDHYSYNDVEIDNNKPNIDMEKLKEILYPEGFIFVM